jgi:hypothetical protein
MKHKKGKQLHLAYFIKECLISKSSGKSTCTGAGSSTVQVALDTPQKHLTAVAECSCQSPETTTLKLHTCKMVTGKWLGKAESHYKTF